MNYKFFIAKPIKAHIFNVVTNEYDVPVYVYSCREDYPFDNLEDAVQDLREAYEAEVSLFPSAPTYGGNIIMRIPEDINSAGEGLGTYSVPVFSRNTGIHFLKMKY